VSIVPKLKPNENLAVKELSKDEVISIYMDELKRKDEIIHKLESENKLLLELTMKNTKKRLEEKDIKFKYCDAINSAEKK
jgi:hypothetical protein